MLKLLVILVVACTGPSLGFEMGDTEMDDSFELMGEEEGAFGNSWETSDEIEARNGENSLGDEDASVTRETDDTEHDDEDADDDIGVARIKQLERQMQKLTEVVDSKIPSRECALTGSAWLEVFRFSTADKDVVYDSWAATFEHSLRAGGLWRLSTRARFTMRNKDVSHHMVLDISNTDGDSWFSPSRVLETSYSDLTNSSYNFFSTRGEHSRERGESKGHARRFFVNRNYHGCPNDYGWFVVVDGDTDERRFVCPWERLNGAVDKLPRLMICPGQTGCLWQSEAVFADELLIEIYLK